MGGGGGGGEGLSDYKFGTCIGRFLSDGAVSMAVKGSNLFNAVLFTKRYWWGGGGGGGGGGLYCHHQNGSCTKTASDVCESNKTESTNHTICGEKLRRAEAESN